MKIFLIRHGQTTGDLEDRYGGSYDDHLTPHGQDQLKETGGNLVTKGIEIILSSKLIRAQEAAQIIGSEINIPIETVEGIEERHYGVLTGLTKAEALEKYPEVVEAHKDPANTDLEGESFVDFQNRVLLAFKDIALKNYSTVAVVSHGGPIKQILKHLNLPIPDTIKDGAVIEIDL
jgi:broad specificity phosphatase PhoE